MEQAKRQQEQSSSSSSSGHPTEPSSAASSASYPVITSLPHRNKHAPPPKVKLFQPPLVPYNPTQQASTQPFAAKIGSGSRADPIVFGESSPIGSRSNPFQTARPTHTATAAPSSSSASTSSYAASQPFRCPTQNHHKHPSSLLIKLRHHSRTTIPSTNRLYHNHLLQNQEQNHPRLH